MQAGAGTAAAFSDSAYSEAGATVAPDAAGAALGSAAGGAGQPAERRGGGRAAPGRRAPELLRRGPVRGRPARAGGQGRHRLQLRPAAPDQPRPGHGRAQLAGHRLGLPRRPGGRRAAGQVLPHVHDGGRHRAPGQGVRDGRRGGGPAVDRHGAAARRGGQGLRRARRRQGGSGEPRRHLLRHRRLGGGRRRVRTRADPRGARPPACRAGRGGRPLRRRHHHGGRPRAQGADPADHGHGRGDGPGRRRRRHGGGPGRQLRAHQGGRGGRPPGRADRGHGQPAVGHADARELPVRAQRGQRRRAHGTRGLPGAGLGRRDRDRHVRPA